MKKADQPIVANSQLPKAPPEPTEAELIARRNAALAEYGIKDERIIPDASVPEPTDE